MLYIIYVELESLINKIERTVGNPEKSSTEKIFPADIHCQIYGHSIK